jgi:hypothetical protein
MKKGVSLPHPLLLQWSEPCGLKGLQIELNSTYRKCIVLVSCLGICGRHTSNETSVPSKQGSLHHWHMYTYDSITKLCRQQAQVIQHHENINVRNIGQGEAQQ